MDNLLCSCISLPHCYLTIFSNFLNLYYFMNTLFKVRLLYKYVNLYHFYVHLQKYIQHMEAIHFVVITPTLWLVNVIDFWKICFKCCIICSGQLPPQERMRQEQWAQQGREEKPLETLWNCHPLTGRKKPWKKTQGWAEVGRKEKWWGKEFDPLMPKLLSPETTKKGWSVWMVT